jgi:hypothetical protein
VGTFNSGKLQVFCLISRRSSLADYPSASRLPPGARNRSAFSPPDFSSRIPEVSEVTYSEPIWKARPETQAQARPGVTRPSSAQRATVGVPSGGEFHIISFCLFVYLSYISLYISLCVSLSLSLFSLFISFSMCASLLSFFSFSHVWLSVYLCPKAASTIL